MSPKEKWLFLLKHFLIVFVPVSIIFTALLGYIYNNQRSSILNDIKARELSKVNRGVTAIETGYKNVISDLLTLSSRPILSRLIRNPAADRAEFLEELQVFIENKQVYDQISLVNAKFQENFLVENRNGQAVIMPPVPGNSPRDRYYLAASQSLQPKQVYVSPIALKVPSSNVIPPDAPSLRFVAPVFTSPTTLAGVLVINFQAQALIREFKTACSGTLSTCSLVNPQGYWIVGPSPDQEWGFALPERRHHSFAQAYPELWQQIQAEKTGQVFNHDGLFTFHTVFPLRATHITSELNSPIAVNSSRYFLVIVDHITPETFHRAFYPLAWQLGVTLIIALSVITFAAIIYAKHQLRKYELLEQIKASEHTFRYLSDSVPVGIFQANAEGISTYSNQKMLEIYGISQEELAKGAWVNFIHPDDRDAMVASWFESVKNQAPWQYQFRLVRDGYERWIVGRGTPVFVEGELTGYIGSYEDLTQAMEQQKYLEQAKDAAEEASRAKSDFLATMSHEIRTPMNAIIGLTGLLLDMELTEQQHEFLNTIRASGDALLSLINDILDFSKIESGKLEIEAYPFDLRACVEEALDLLAARAHERSLELAYHMNPELPSSVTGDMGRLRQILVNLIGNALKFTLAGEVVLYVEGRTLSPQERANMNCDNPDYPCHEFQFAIRDTGIGISPSGALRLFQPFSQVDASTTRNFGGTGLGLAICKRLAESMGGTIWLESRDSSGELAKAGNPPDLFCSVDIPQTGSVFYFSIVLPVSIQAESAKSNRSIATLQDRKVLIVDDNATNRQILILQTESWLMQPQAYENAETALAGLKAGAEFDLGILDLHMPGMNGLELGQAIHELTNHEKLPLIMLSSVGQGNNLIASRHFAAAITKPIKQSALFNVLLRILNESQAVQAESKSITPDVSLAEMSNHLPPLKILLAEDNKVNQMVALRILERLGYRADVAGNGLEVLEALHRQPYDVVLMDMQMPEMDGVTATQEIHAQFPQEKHPRIIAMTANAMQGDRELCLDAGMDDYVSKPIKIPDLVRALGDCQPREVLSTP